MKRSSRQIMKAFNRVTEDAKGNIKRKQQQQQKQQQIQILEKVHLEQDEFTEHKEVKHALIDFVVEAQSLETSYQAHRKQMIRTIALKLEDELRRIGKLELVCRISVELINILKQVGIRWNPIYLRRCLDERYKDPTNRANALARKKHPGVPQDTGKTEEELEASLNRKPGWGQEYVVKTVAEYSKEFSKRSFNKESSQTLLAEGILSMIPTEDGKKVRVVIKIPVVARVRPVEQIVILETDTQLIEESTKKNLGDLIASKMGSLA